MLLRRLRNKQVHAVLERCVPAAATCTPFAAAPQPAQTAVPKSSAQPAQSARTLPRPTVPATQATPPISDGHRPAAVHRSVRLHGCTSSGAYRMRPVA